jgi:peptidoglycan/LPS O-acetylase OafA/YrhL
MPELDVLRGVAIVSVLAYHAFYLVTSAAASRVDFAMARITHPGWLGVDLFFVLSGFLITGRLLDARPLPAREFFGGFYMRRVLRILPLYYLVLFVIGGTLYVAGQASSTFLWLSVVYLPNVALAAGVPAAYPLGVLWSLGVEEQVYLVWPLVVRRLTPLALAGFFVAVCLAEPALRYVMFPRDPAQESQWMLTWLRLDGFAGGGLLALAARSRWCTIDRLFWMAIAAAVTAGGVVVVMQRAGVLSRITRAGASLQFAVVDLVFCSVVGLALATWSRRPPTGMLSAVLRYCGRVSYCLYLVHQFIFWIYDRLAPAVWSRGATVPPALLRGVIGVCISMMIAELSWRFVEAPILSLKSHFAAGERIAVV